MVFSGPPTTSHSQYNRHPNLAGDLAYFPSTSKASKSFSDTGFALASQSSMMRHPYSFQQPQMSHVRKLWSIRNSLLSMLHQCF